MKLIESAQLRYYRKHKIKCLERQKSYYQANQESEIERVSTWRKQHPDKHRVNLSKYGASHKKEKTARLQAWRKVPLGDRCEFCESTQNLERHHPDYDKPLEVRTACGKCNCRQEAD